MKTNHNNLRHPATAKNQNAIAKSHPAIVKNNQNRFTKLPGFTIAELSLAMGFISVLLITIAILIVNISGTFQKGLSIKSVDTMGQSLSDNLSRTIAASRGSNFNQSKDSYYHQWKTNNPVKISNTSGRNSNTSSNVPTHGEFRTGGYTYIWNTGYVLNENSSIFKDIHGNSITNAQAKVTAPDKTYENFRLLRVSGDYHSDNGQYTVGTVPVELLAASESALAIYDLQIFSAAYDINTQHAYVSGSFILGTVNGGIDITSNTNFCTDIPNGISTDFNYCAINKFSFGSRTGIGKKDTSDLGN